MVGKLAGEVNTSGSGTGLSAETENGKSPAAGDHGPAGFRGSTGVSGRVCPNRLFSGTCDTFYSALLSIRWQTSWSRVLLVPGAKSPIQNACPFSLD